MFADALVRWSAERLALRAAVHPLRDDRVQHWFASDGLISLDADGVGSDHDALTKLALLGSSSGCRLLPPGENVGSHVLPCAETSRRLADLLRGRFGQDAAPYLDEIAATLAGSG